MPRDFLDGISEYPVSDATSRGLDVTSYTGNARFSSPWFTAAAAAGALVMVIQETYSTRSQEGPIAGGYDVSFAGDRTRQRAVRCGLALVVSDGNWADNWDASGYGQGASDALNGYRDVFSFAVPYGAKAVCASFLAGARTGSAADLFLPGVDGLPGDWVPETWGNGTVAAQVVGDSPIPSTDLNHARVDLHGGVDPALPSPEEDEMYWLKCVETDQLLAVSEYRVAGYVLSAQPAGSPTVASATACTKDERDVEIVERDKLAAKLGGGGGGGPLPPTDEQVDAALANLRVTRV